MFSNLIDPGIKLGNFTANISDHLPEFAIIPNMFGTKSQAINLIFKKVTDQKMIEKVLFLVISLLTGEIC